ncbi:xanthine dehydrogenase family protein molybdopterin-binding subunit [Tistrella bauzanensis]|uniref:xanthine dehydrogenase family protein molybdopterin-binding subunit n=1 Tax=Tistrella TaxID=171436 RepID=UPI0031F6ECD4
MLKFGIGQSVRRVEDRRFLTGHGRYTDDIVLDGQLYASFVRSPYASARINAVDVADARAADGVVAVFTGADLDADGIGGVPAVARVKNADGTPMQAPKRPAIASDAVHFAGEAVAMVIATDPVLARDAAELVAVDYEERPVVVDPARALAGDTVAVHDGSPGNLCFDWRQGKAAEVDAAMAAAATVVEIDIVNNRVSANPIEPRAINAHIDAETGQTVVHTNGQGVHGMRGILADAVFKVPADEFRVVMPDVGGGFGMKIFLYPEHVAVTYAARKLRRPVKWTGDRSESLLTDAHGRDLRTHARMALDTDGRFTAFEVDTIANLGAYASQFGAMIPTSAAAGLATTVYDIPVASLHVRGVFTNTAPVDAYRGAGRPEANYLIERLVDAAARATGRTPEALRQINYIRPDAMPHTNAMGTTYDTGDFAEMQRRALAAADMAGFAERRRQSEARGLLRGIGLASYIEWTQGNPKEEARIRFEADGSATVLVGTQSNGQGHETAFAQVAAELTGMPFDKVRVVMGDTAEIRTGGGTGGSRSLQMAGSAIRLASEAVVERARGIAADRLEAASDDIRFEAGRFTVAGTDLGIGIEEVARIALDGGEPLDESRVFDRPAPTFPNGCHVAEVEIDPETGRVEPVRYTVADDFGKVVNPMIVKGQVQGGVAQGLGQALIEHAVYDDDSGQLMTGSFMDYGMPRADDMIFLDITLHEDMPTASSGLGSKGCGEAGTIGACPAIMNAINDALTRAGAPEIDMPATPARVWAVLTAARATAAA